MIAGSAPVSQPPAGTPPRDGAAGTAGPPQQGPFLRLPFHRPRVTYAMLLLVGIAFVAEIVTGGTSTTALVMRYGVQVNPQVASGELWRLLSAIFLHFSLTHIAFNAWALFSLGRDVEAFYGPVWFAVLYLTTGLFGNVAYYLLGNAIPSAGASGAVFGLVGAEAAFFLENRRLLGKFGRERLANLAVLVGINLVFGFTVQGINNIAHLGGLLSGLVLGLALAPRYRIETGYVQSNLVRMLVDARSRPIRVAAAAVALVLLLGGVALGNQRWLDNPATLRQRALEAYSAGDLSGAQTLLEAAAKADPASLQGLLMLGVIDLRLGQASSGVEVLEQAQLLAPDNPDVMFYLAVAYAEIGKQAAARPLLVRFLREESVGERADYAREVLGTSP